MSLLLRRCALKVIPMALWAFILSCNQVGITQRELQLQKKELDLKQKRLELREKNLSFKTKDTSHKTTSLKTKINSVNTKVMEMIFEEYSEGDLMHLTFKDVATGEEYDFGNGVDIKRFNGIKILLEDSNSEFGYRANPQYINKIFIVKALCKTVVASDPVTGRAIQIKAWIIGGLQERY